MTNYKKVNKTLWGFGPHYKACMKPVTTYDFIKVDDKLDICEVHAWEVKVYGRLGTREVERYTTVREAYNRLRFLIYDYEEDFKIWGEMMP